MRRGKPIERRRIAVGRRGWRRSCRCGRARGKFLFIWSHGTGVQRPANPSARAFLPDGGGLWHKHGHGDANQAAQSPPSARPPPSSRSWRSTMSAASPPAGRSSLPIWGESCASEGGTETVDRPSRRSGRPAGALGYVDDRAFALVEGPGADRPRLWRAAGQPGAGACRNWRRGRQRCSRPGRERGCGSGACGSRGAERSAPTLQIRLTTPQRERALAAMVRAGHRFRDCPRNCRLEARRESRSGSYFLICVNYPYVGFHDTVDRGKETGCSV